MERIRSLDGLRAISILMVIFGHAGQTIPYHIDHFLAYKLITDATLGVRIFFVISGFLITKLLLIEKEKTGDIRIRNFYERREIRKRCYNYYLPDAFDPDSYLFFDAWQQGGNWNDDSYRRG